MPKTDTFAANHGQNRSRGRAVRSDSAMISMPVVSTRPGPPAEVGAAGSGTGDDEEEEGDMVGSGWAGGPPARGAGASLPRHSPAGVSAGSWRRRRSRE